MHIPQSTSLSTIAAIGGVGFFHHDVNWAKIQYLAVCWAASIIVSYALIYAAARYIYPPRNRNFWVYERIVNHQDRLKLFVILTSCYKAFAQGTNNVANAVGPLSAAGIMDVALGLWIMGLFFGAGAFGFSGPLKTSGEKIVPLGLLTATVINVVSGTITIVASKLGVPLPTVMVYTVAIFAIGSIKDGAVTTLEKPVTKKTFFNWCINPVITFAVSYVLSLVFLK
jgi:sulfate permease